MNGRGAKVVAILVTLLMVAAIAAMVIMRPTLFDPLLNLVGISSSPSASTSGNGAKADLEAFSGVQDQAPTEAEVAQEQEEWVLRHQTPLVAQVGGVDLRSPIEPSALTGVLFHQASYGYALVLTTELPEADYEKVQKKRQIRVNTAQEEGEWLDADALHLWRTGDTTAMDTSIDIGALPGTVVRSPVTGTVVLVKDYKLYDEVPDIEIHIQPLGHPELDCVLIHTVDPLVSAGDKVEAGLTEISHVRDIEKDLTDVQLGFYTPEGVGGNHTHVQVNDANDKGYKKDKLKGAFKVKDE